VINFRDWPLDRDGDGSWSTADTGEREDCLKSGHVPFDYPETVAADFPECLEIIEREVKPERTRRDERGEFVLRYPLYERWWQFAEKQKALIAALERQTVALVRARIANMHAMFLAPKGWVYNEKVVVFPGGSFAIFQSSVHEVWARDYSSTLKADMQYTPSNCCETFPFPSSVMGVDSIGDRYHTYRRDIMLSRNEGLTKTYHRFHRASEHSEDIAMLRRLHVEMDEAVSAAYGWTELELEHGFHETRQGVRYTISGPARRSVLDRLLALNHERYAEEVQAGLHDKKVHHGPRSRISGRTKLRKSAIQGELL